MAATKLKIDKKYVSDEKHEITHIIDLFSCKGEHPPRMLVCHMQLCASTNTGGKVLRTDFYTSLESLGYKKTKG